MTDLIIKHFGSKDIRIIDKDGNPWFVAKDVCSVLGFDNPSDATKYLDSDEKTLISNPTGTGGSKTTIINESGLYSLILKSRKKEAKEFKKWVTSEVLPSIRKTGQYSDTWIVERAKSKSVRNGFTSTLKEHGYKSPIEYIKTTNSMKKELGINCKRKKDDLSLIELCKVQAAENLSMINIIKEDVAGYAEVRPLCEMSCTFVQLATGYGEKMQAGLIKKSKEVV